MTMPDALALLEQIAATPAERLAVGLALAGLLLLAAAALLPRLLPARGRHRRPRVTPQGFERLVAETFRARGYAVENRRYSGDHGVDLLVRRGRERAVVQCKRYSGSVGEPVIRDLYGAMGHEGANRGYVVTSGRFTDPARRWARGKRIVLVDGDSAWWNVSPLERWWRGVRLLGAGVALGSLVYLASVHLGPLALPGGATPLPTAATPTPTLTRPSPSRTSAATPEATPRPPLISPTPPSAVR